MPAQLLDVNGTAQIDGNLKTNNGYDQIYTNSNTAGTWYSLTFYRSEGTFGTPAVTNSGDKLGGFSWQGYSGTGYTSAATIQAIQNGAASTQTPTDLVIYTSNGTVLGEVMRATASGNVGIGTTSPQSTLAVVGGAAIGSYAGNGTSVSSGNLIVSGSVGIGTTTTAQPLEVNGNIQVDGSRIITGVDLSNMFWINNVAGSEPNSNSLGYQTDGAGNVTNIKLQTEGSTYPCA